jgi:hypothetical protein
MVMGDKKCLKKREFTYRHKGQVLVQVWRGKREVKFDFNTTQKCGTEKKKRKDETMKKPEVIHDYNNFLRGVNRPDQILHYYPCFGKTTKWTKKCVFILLYVAAQNSFILFEKYTTHQNQKGKGYLSSIHT